MRKVSDGVLAQKRLVEVTCGLTSVRALRTALLDLAYQLGAKRQAESAILVLSEPKMTEARLDEEWRSASATFKPQISDRLIMVLLKGEQIRTWPAERYPEIQSELKELLPQNSLDTITRLPRGNPQDELLKILIHQFLLNKGPMTADWLGNMAGCSYPTVAAALRRFSDAIERLRDRRIQLSHFPAREWSRLLAVSGEARLTMRFVDRSGQKRSAESLLGRISRLERSEIAVGGVFAAKHYYPEIDLVGSPRLDVSIHAPDCTADPGWVARLDPALQKSDDSREPASIVLHFLRRRASLFEKGADGFSWTDPVETLLDLHEATLEPQALELLEYFINRKSETK